MSKQFMKAIKAMVFLWLLVSLPSYSAISAEQFFTAPLVSNATLRPDGNAVLLTKEENDTQYIALKPIDAGSEKVIFTPSKHGTSDAKIGAVYWLDNRYFAVQFLESKTGVADLINTKLSRRLLIIDSQASPESPQQVLGVKTPGWIVGRSVKNDGHFFYAKSGMQSHIYQLKPTTLQADKAPLSKTEKIDGGQFIRDNQVKQINGYATRWFRGENDTFKAVLHFSAPYTLTLTEFKADGSPDQLYSWKLLESSKGKNSKKEKQSPVDKFLPMAIGPNENEYYCLDRTESESKSLHLVNFKKSSHILVYETSAFKIIDLVFSPERKLIGTQVLKNGRIITEPLSNSASHFTSAASETKLKLNIDASVDAQRQLFYEEAHNQPGQFWIETKSPQSRILVGEKLPSLKGKITSRQIEGEIKIDNLEIPYLLNLPATRSKTPLIVMPHGGPLGIFDTPYFDPLTQYFTAQGFAVLRVNFRGSGGRSQQLRDAGRKEWGGKMLDDIHQTTLAILTRSELDKSRVCLFGISYGGYAASMLVMQHPETYRCAAAVAGVYDLNLHLQSPQLSEKENEWFAENVGDYNTEYDDLKAISPVFLAEKLQQPLLLLHGDKDDIVDIEQSSRMALSLQSAGKAFLYKTLVGQGHHITSPTDAAKILSPSTEFLHSNL